MYFYQSIAADCHNSTKATKYLTQTKSTGITVYCIGSSDSMVTTPVRIRTWIVSLKRKMLPLHHRCFKHYHYSDPKSQCRSSLNSVNVNTKITIWHWKFEKDKFLSEYTQITVFLTFGKHPFWYMSSSGQITVHLLNFFTIGQGCPLYPSASVYHLIMKTCKVS